uniref:Uncharacterized protein n=1 Tax=Anguilla anguilla TaxID=7936 RepID=A0A0E9U567_ANGAN
MALSKMTDQITDCVITLTKRRLP